MANIIDLSGKHFYRFFVLSLDHVDKTYGAYWLCQCSCGNKVVIWGDNLRRGLSKSCGCLRIETSKKNFINLIGQRFGKLVVLKRLENKIQPSGQIKVQFLCQCDCGNKKKVSSTSLKSERVKSCGCLSESFIASELKKYCVENYNAILEYKILRNPETKHWLKCDIFIEKYNVFIEINGEQHYKLNAWHVRMANKNKTTPEEEFEYQKRKDRLKRSFYKKRGFYIEINLTKNKSLENIIIYIKEMLHEQITKHRQY